MPRIINMCTLYKVHTSRFPMMCACIKKQGAIVWWWWRRWWKKTSGSSRQGRVIRERRNRYILKPIAEAFLFKANKACDTILAGLMSLLEQKCEGLRAPVEVEEAQCVENVQLSAQVRIMSSGEIEDDSINTQIKMQIHAQPRVFKGRSSIPGVR